MVIKLHNSQLHVTSSGSFTRWKLRLFVFFLGPPSFPGDDPSGFLPFRGKKTKKRQSKNFQEGGGVVNSAPFFGFSGIIEIPFWHLLTRWVSTKAQKPKHDQTSAPRWRWENGSVPLSGNMFTWATADWFMTRSLEWLIIIVHISSLHNWVVETLYAANKEGFSHCTCVLAQIRTWFYFTNRNLLKAGHFSR